MTTLYELEDSYKNLMANIELGVDEKAFADTLEAIEDSLEGKVEGYHAVIRQTEGDIETIKGEEKRLAERRRSMENKVKRMKEHLQESMIAMDKRKIKTPLFTANIQKNAPSVRVIDEGLIPKSYFVEQKPQLDKKQLIQSLKNGEDTAGAELVQTESIRFR
ncbi:siphovirus Gp157 family protein [Natribacillus halophilus]|uniref:Virus Gp157 n=1 Tax=Natribacillus halophilus TaxID=549003 RepID=A0A1G8RW09_9BACI|nr:siphovirus Gp157 family protein [Natribacillus halophilus]SDJ20695.1 virus Gp157 [Natribacillus halophilus]